MQRIALADGFYISCPEYAHGIPGFKNALDWVVSSGEFIGKPIAFLNASPIVKASLTEDVNHNVSTYYRRSFCAY